MIHWFIDSLIHWFIHCFIDEMIDSFINWFIEWFIDSITDLYSGGRIDCWIKYSRREDYRNPGGGKYTNTLLSIFSLLPSLLLSSPFLSSLLSLPFTPYPFPTNTHLSTPSFLPSPLTSSSSFYPFFSLTHCTPSVFSCRLAFLFFLHPKSSLPTHSFPYPTALLPFSPAHYPLFLLTPLLFPTYPFFPFPQCTPFFLSSIRALTSPDPPSAPSHFFTLPSHFTQVTLCISTEEK